MIINMNGAKAPETSSPVLQEKTVTPETLPTVVGADEGYDGLSQVTVNPDTNLKAENIRSGKTIFGVDGSFVGEPVFSDTLVSSDLYRGYNISSNTGHFGIIYNGIKDFPEPVSIDFTKRKTFEYMASSIIGTNAGGLAVYSEWNYSEPKAVNSSYVPSGGNWYHVQETLNGTYDCHLYHYATVRLFGPTKLNLNHIKGTAWLVPKAFTPSGTYTLVSTSYEGNFIQGNIIKVDLDTDLVQVSDTDRKFSINITAELEAYINKSEYSSETKYALGFYLVPDRIVTT